MHSLCALPRASTATNMQHESPGCARRPLASATIESRNQALRVASTASGTSMGGVVELLRAQMDVFAPVVLYDHVAAFGAWALLYVIEVIIIVSVLNKYPDDAQKAVRVPHASPRAAAAVCMCMLCNRHISLRHHHSLGACRCLKCHTYRLATSAV